MGIRVLQIGHNAKRKVKKVVTHAKKKANWYNPSVPGWMSNIPGHDRRHQCKLDSFRCVFSYTVDAANNRVVRHLSISIPSDKYTNPGIVLVISRLFGFTEGNVDSGGFPEDWEIRVKEDGPIDDHCVVVGQDTGIRP